jgi:hypothetical protein
MAVGNIGFLGDCLHGLKWCLSETVCFSSFDEIFLSSAESRGRATASNENADR